MSKLKNDNLSGNSKKYDFLKLKNILLDYGILKVTISAISCFFIADILHFGFHKIETTACPPQYAKIAKFYRYGNDLVVAVSISYMGSKISKKNMGKVIHLLVLTGLTGLVTGHALTIQKIILLKYPILSLLNHIILAWLSHAIVALSRIHYYDPTARAILNRYGYSKYQTIYFLFRGLLYSISKMIFYGSVGEITMIGSWFYYAFLLFIMFITISYTTTSHDHVTHSKNHVHNGCCGSQNIPKTESFKQLFYRPFDTLYKQPKIFLMMYFSDIFIGILHKKYHDYHICAMHTGQKINILVPLKLAKFEFKSSLILAIAKVNLIFQELSANYWGKIGQDDNNKKLGFYFWTMKNLVYLIMRVGGVKKVYSYFYYNTIRRNIIYYKYQLHKISEPEIADLETLQLAIFAIAGQINI